MQGLRPEYEVYVGSPLADFCAFLRRKGHEAYYFHASASSMVTVGAFGPQAVITTADGRVHYSAEVRALQQDVLLKHNLVNGRVFRVINDEGIVNLTADEYGIQPFGE